jgi:hypothetical protein
MTTTNEAYRKAANSPAGRQAAETAKSIGEEVSDFAGDVGRMTSKQYGTRTGSAHVALKAAVNPKCDSTVFETNLKECRATLP